MLARMHMDEQQWRQHWQNRWQDAKERAAGNWGEILGSKAPQLRKALDAAGKRHSPCPSPNHPESKDAFRVFKDYASTGGGVCNTCGTFRDGFAMLRWINGWSGKEVLEEVESYLGNRIGRHAPRIPIGPVVNKDTALENESLRRSLNRVWLESVPIGADKAEPARRYLARRGLALNEFPNLMFHPALVYHDGQKIVGRFPAMVAMVYDQAGKPVTIHRTYLTSDGQKADVESPKKLMSYPDDRKIMGGAIHLCKPGRVLAVAEGIETALAVWLGTGIPTWATVNAVMMENFVPPQGVEQLIIFADKDRPSKVHPAGHGQEASKALVVKTWPRGIKAMAITPHGEIPDGEKSLDWLDVLKRDGASGFPSLDSIRRKMLFAA